MPYFTLADHPQLPVVVAKITDRKPKPVDKDGFRCRYLAEVHEHGRDGAQQVIEWLDDAMGPRTKAPGFYQAPYDEVYANYAALVSAHVPQRTKRHPLIRVGAGLLALGILVVMTALMSLGAIAWLAISAFKKQSGLLTMAETAVLWSIFDWRPLVLKLGRIALHGQ